MQPTATPYPYDNPYNVDTSKVAFVKASDVLQRYINYDEMNYQVNALKNNLSGKKLVRVSNYRNVNGWAPKRNGSVYDAYGVYYTQCCAAYYKPSTSSDFRYFMDGEFLIYLYDAGNGFTAVSHPKYGGTYFVKSYYLVDTSTSATKFILIDLENQNQAAIEYKNGKWQVLGVSYCATGANTQYRLPTERGWFKLLAEEYTMLYYFDGDSTRFQGYARYALRFSGGTYVHGVPTDYIYHADGSKTTPDPIEYGSYIGVIPTSHKCVNSYTSYVKFLYEWAELNNTVIIVY